MMFLHSEGENRDVVQVIIGNATVNAHKVVF